MAKGESPKIILAAMASADRGREDKEAMDQSKKGRFEVDPELGLGVAIHNPVPSGTSWAFYVQSFCFVKCVGKNDYLGFSPSS